MSIKSKIRGNLKSKTSWAGALTVAAGVVSYLAASPEIVAAYGPQAVIGIGILNIVLRQFTDRAVEHK